MPKFHGVVPPVVVPLDAQGRPDMPAYGRVLDHLVAQGCHGLFVLGSTSEVVFYGEAQRARLIEHSVAVAAGRVPVIAGVIDPTTDRVIAHARAAKAAGANAVVVTAPFYTLTDQQETLTHFRRIRDAVDLPIVAYDIPVCVHTKLGRHTVATLAREGVICGLKDSSGDDANLRYVALDTRDLADFFVMTGSEIMVDTALFMGAHGVVPGLANVDPAGYVRLWNAVQQGDLAAARREQERLCRLFEIVWVASSRLSAGAAGVGGFKTAMRCLGLIGTNQMASPRGHLDEAETRRVQAILRDVGLL